MRRIFLTIALSLVVSLPASAQQLKLVFNDGRVSLDATGVPVRAVLAEWGKLGGTKVIGAERITGSPLTLKLENVPESQALEIVLRSVAGYMAAPRSAAATAGASQFDRILVLATSATPPPAAARPMPAPSAGPANRRFVPPRQPARQVADDEEEEPEEEEDPNPPNAPVFTFPGQGGQNGAGGQQPPFLQNAPPGVGQPTITFNPNTGQPQSITISPTQKPGGSTTFGTPTPGMIVAPAPTTPQPGTQVRPPGGA
ncbi:MAG: hypothetical protein AB7P34_01090 [Vicinamibacterales bacterium]